MRYKRIVAIVVLLFNFNGGPAFAQKIDSVKPKTDSVKPSFMARMHAFSGQAQKESQADLDSDKTAIEQKKVLEDLKKNFQKAKVYLRSGIDTLDIRADLRLIQKNFQVAGDGVFTHKGTAQTFRNLTTTSKILEELLSRTLTYKTKLDIYQQQLSLYRYQLDSLSGATVLFKFPQDSIGTRKYVNQLILVAREVEPVDNVLTKAGGDVQILLNDINATASKLQVSLEELETAKSNLADNAYKREFVNIWAPDAYSRPLSAIFAQSRAKAALTLYFYINNNQGKLSLMLLLVILVFIYIRSLKNIYIENDLLTNDFEGQLVLRYPLLSASVIVINIFQFLLYSPPFILSVILWLISGVCLSFLFKKFISRYWMNVWLVMFILFLISALDNLILQASRAERWMMLIIAALGVITTLLSLLWGHRDELREKWIVYSITLAGILETCSIFSNLFGRYNLAKSLLIGGFMNAVVAIVFLWVVRLINEGLFLAYNVYTKQDKKLFYLNFQRIGQRAPITFYILMVCGWIILFGRNFPAFDSYANPLKNFFAADRTIGSYTFSINNLLLFVFILVVSVIISKIISFFASDQLPIQNKGNTPGLHGIGSWLLLIRIAILSLGLFLALAASGISLDKITIVVGALGVGIGFGLQNLVNNLVSGLIIAFEKPVNVGDVVDIGPQGGTMKSIGFRSSVIATPDGADVVIPNGDLLSAHLTNWSMSGKGRRMSILMGIAYDSDFSKVKQITTTLLETDERIATSPGYIVQYEQFSAGAVDLRIYFWAKHAKEAADLKGDLIVAIIEGFAKNGIVIKSP